MEAKRTRAAQLTAIAEQQVRAGPPTIGGRPVTVEDVACAAIVGDAPRKDMESSRAKAVAEATMYGLGAILDALAAPPTTPNGAQP